MDDGGVDVYVELSWRELSQVRIPAVSLGRFVSYQKSRVEVGSSDKTFPMNEHLFLKTSSPVCSSLSLQWKIPSVVL